MAQFVGNVLAQYGGACVGALCTKGLFFDSNGTGLGANQVNASFTNQEALLGEMVMTCLLILTVLQTACEPRSIAKNMAPTAIGTAVFLGHTVLLNVVRVVVDVLTCACLLRVVWSLCSVHRTAAVSTPRVRLGPLPLETTFATFGAGMFVGVVG